jgi:hypothetical protein
MCRNLSDIHAEKRAVRGFNFLLSSIQMFYSPHFTSFSTFFVLAQHFMPYERKFLYDLNMNESILSFFERKLKCRFTFL